MDDEPEQGVLFEIEGPGEGWLRVDTQHRSAQSVDAKPRPA